MFLHQRAVNFRSPVQKSSLVSLKKGAGCEISHFNQPKSSSHFRLFQKKKHIAPRPFSHHLHFLGLLFGKTRSGLESAHPMAAPTNLTSNERWPEANSPGPSVPIASRNRRFFDHRNSQPMLMSLCWNTCFSVNKKKTWRCGVVTIQLLFGGKNLGDEIHVSKVFFVVEN